MYNFDMFKTDIYHVYHTIVQSVDSPNVPFIVFLFYICSGAACMLQILFLNLMYYNLFVQNVLKS